MEATTERTMKSEAEAEKSEGGEVAEALVKNYMDNEWWTVEFNFANESVYVYRTTLCDFKQVWANKSAKKRGRYIAVKRKDLEELDVYLKLGAWWDESGSYSVDVQRLVATTMAGAFAGEELQRLYAEAVGKTDKEAERTAENVNRIHTLWDWRQKLGGMIELAVRRTVRWMR